MGADVVDRRVVAPLTKDGDHPSRDGKSPAFAVWNISLFGDGHEVRR